MSPAAQLHLLFAEPQSGQAADGGHPHAGRHQAVTLLCCHPLRCPEDLQ